MSRHIPFYDELTPEVVDQSFPLQEPDGAIEKVKVMLERGDTEGAETLFQGLREVDGNTVETEARRVTFEERFNRNDPEVARAIRIGIQVGMLIGRKEGANVVNRILSEGQGE